MFWSMPQLHALVAILVHIFCELNKAAAHNKCSGSSTDIVKACNAAKESWLYGVNYDWTHWEDRCQFFRTNNLTSQRVNYTKFVIKAETTLNTSLYGRFYRCDGLRNSHDDRAEVYNAVTVSTEP
ncbi:hypothetical protein V5799_015157, partial [Amblyomma americanum]